MGPREFPPQFKQTPFKHSFTVIRPKWLPAEWAGRCRVAELMQNETFLVSPEGRWLPEGSQEFLREVGDLDPDYDAAMFAVKNLGFIKVEIITELVVSITLHPSNVDLNSLIAVNHVLSKS